MRKGIKLLWMKFSSILISQRFIEFNIKSVMRFVLLSLIVLLIITSSCHQSFQDSTEIMDLSGIWNFQLDPDNVGMKDKWFRTCKRCYKLYWTVCKKSCICDACKKPPGHSNKCKPRYNEVTKWTTKKKTNPRKTTQKKPRK